MKWYQQPVWIIILLFLFFPVGLYLMWKYADWNKKAKWAISGFFALLVVVSFAVDTPTSEDTASETPQTTTTAEEETSAKEAEVQQKPEEKAESKAEEESSKPKWVTVTKLNGSSNKKGDIFSLEGGKQRLTYTITGDELSIVAIYVMEEGKTLDKDGGFTEVTADGPGSDSTFMFKGSGNYYLDVSSANVSWTIKIEEER